MYRSYTRAQLAELTGVSERTITDWITEGYIPRAGTRLQGGNYTDLHVRRIRELIALCKDGRVTLRDVAERHQKVHA